MSGTSPGVATSVRTTEWTQAEHVASGVVDAHADDVVSGPILGLGARLEDGRRGRRRAPRGGTGRRNRCNATASGAVRCAVSVP